MKSQTQNRYYGSNKRHQPYHQRQKRFGNENVRPQVNPYSGYYGQNHQYQAFATRSQPWESQWNYYKLYSQPVQTNLCAPPQPAGKLDVHDLVKNLVQAGMIPDVSNQNAKSKPVLNESRIKVPICDAKPIKSQVPKSTQISPVELISFDITLKTRQEGIVNQIHDFSGHKCSSCSQRFSKSESEEYRNHLDWHFRTNMQKQKKIQRRGWYSNASGWVTADRKPDFREETTAENIEENKTEICTVVKSDDPKENICSMCNEGFDEVLIENGVDDWYGEYYLKGAIRPKGQFKVYHVLCLKDAEKQG